MWENSTLQPLVGIKYANKVKKLNAPHACLGLVEVVSLFSTSKDIKQIWDVKPVFTGIGPFNKEPDIVFRAGWPASLIYMSS